MSRTFSIRAFAEQLLEYWCIYILAQKTNKIRNWSLAFPNSHLRFLELQFAVLPLKDVHLDSLAECLVIGAVFPIQVLGDID